MSSINNFGQLILGLPKKVETLRQEIEEKQKELAGLVGVGIGIDKVRLTSGRLTGDQLLDAALCFQGLPHYHSQGDSSPWAHNVVQLYELMKKVREKIKSWEGGLMAFRHSYGGNYEYGFDLGKAESPSLDLTFRQINDWYSSSSSQSPSFIFRKYSFAIHSKGPFADSHYGFVPEGLYFSDFMRELSSCDPDNSAENRLFLGTKEVQRFLDILKSKQPEAKQDLTIQRYKTAIEYVEKTLAAET